VSAPPPAEASAAPAATDPVPDAAPAAPAEPTVAAEPEAPAVPSGEPTLPAAADPAASGPAEAPTPFDVVLVLDNSASMRRNDPDTRMRAVVQAFAGDLPAGARMGLVLFDAQADLALALVPAADVAFAGQLTGALGRLGYRGQRTNVPAGVERALYELRTAGRPDAHRVIVLLTDGLVDVGSEARNLAQATWLREQLAVQARDEGVRIFGVAFTEAADVQLIQSLAQVTGGSYSRVLGAEDIGGVFDHVRGRIDELVRAEAAAGAARAAGAPPTGIEKVVTVEKPVVVETEKTTRVVHQKPVIVREPVVTPIPVPEPRVDWRVVLIAICGLVVLGLVALVALRGRRGSADPAMPAARLRMLPEHGKGRVYKLKKPVTRIGRARDNDIVLRAETISAHHAIIEWRDGAFHLTDLGSTNGTQRNGVPVGDRERREPRAVRLRHRDRLNFDRHGVEFVLAAAERVDETRLGSVAAPGGTVVNIESAKGEMPEDSPEPAPHEDPADVTGPLAPVAQKCLIHEGWDATRVCPVCERAWCEFCLTEKAGRAMCRGCAEKAA
jgi:hypothetical protein